MQAHHEARLVEPKSRQKAHGRSSSRRKWHRTPIDAGVELLVPVRATGATLNISAGGVLVAISRPIQAGEICALTLEGQPEMARVAWTRRISSGWLAGLEFVGDDDPVAYYAA